MTTPAPATVWLICAPVQPEWANPVALRPYGVVRTVFPPRMLVWISPENSYAQLYDAFKEFKPNDIVAWLGGDTLTAILVGRALEAHGINEWVWLRYIGRDEYQKIPIKSDGFAPMKDIVP